MTKADNIESLYLYLTNECNMRCKYCFIDKNISKTLDVAMLYRAIDRFITYSSNYNRKYISIIGGEPFLYYKTIERIIDYIRLNYKTYDINIDITTNGTNLNEDRIKFLTIKGVKIYVSIDGLRNINDKYRQFLNNKSSVYEKLLRVIPILKKHTQLNAKMVFSINTLNSFTNNIRSLLKLGFTEIRFTPVMYTKWRQVDLVNLKHSFNKFEHFILSENFTWDKLTKTFPEIEDVWKRVTKYLERRYWWHECRQINVGPDGNYYICDECMRFISKGNNESFTIGNIKQGILWDKRDSLLKEAKKYITYNFKDSFLFFYCPMALYFFCKFSGQSPREWFINQLNFSRVYTASLLQIIKNFKL